MYKITFNSKTSLYAKIDEIDEKFNIRFVRQQEAFVNDILKVRGYIYVNRIYELLGVKWNPKRTNKCFRYEPNVRLNFIIQGSNGDGFDIIIH